MEEKLLKVKTIISEQLDVSIDDLTYDTFLIADLEADSLDLVELIMAFEDEFGIKIDEDRLEEIQTIEDIMDVIE